MKSRWMISVIATTSMVVAFSSVQSAIQPIDATITSVTVYPGRAGITRTAEVNLEAGQQSVVIENLPMDAFQDSFRATATGSNGVVLLGLKHRVEQHLESPQQRVAELEEQIRRIETEKKQAISDRIESFNQQKEFLTAITKGSTNQISDQLVKGGLEVAQWGEAYRFIGKGMRETNDSLRAARQELYGVDQQLEKLRAELASVKSSGTKATRTAQIDLRLAQPGPVRIALDYVTPGANWRPLYDARLIDDKHVDLTYLAEVTQQTGEDWKDVDLTLSTSSPSEGTGPGEFVAWYLSLMEFMERYSNVDKLLEIPAPSEETKQKSEVFIRGGRAGEVAYIVDGTQVKTFAYSVAFKVGRKETVPSGTEATRTTISGWRLDAETKLLCRPYNRQAVYRLVTITNQGDAPLMPGTVAIFAETDFLGNASIREYIAPNEKFDLPFGADKNLEVKREELAYKKSEKNGILSSKDRIEKTIKITLTNHSGEARTIAVEESTPVSQDERIKVKIDDPDPKPLAIDEKGMATWTVSLAPQAEQVILLPYRVEFPQDAEIIGM